MVCPDPASARTGLCRVLLVLFAISPLAGCGRDGLAPTPTVVGRVFSTGTLLPVAGATVSIGAAETTTALDGRFLLSDLTPGPATLRSSATGFEPFEGQITVTSGTSGRDIQLARVERFEFHDFALYVPGTAFEAWGILLALGGPDTRGFASGAPFGAPVPEVEAALQTLGGEFRTLEINLGMNPAPHGLAVLGTSRTALANGPNSDRLLLEAIREGAALSGRPELASAPLLLYGMAAGGPVASGFAARNPGRVAGLFLKVPESVESLTGQDPDALGVPTYVVLAERDAFVDNAALAATFLANRRAGALWGLAMEPGVPHHSLTPAHRALTTRWMSDVLGLRVWSGDSPFDPLGALSEDDGWLGDLATGEIAHWADFAWDRGSASWFPSYFTAEEWQTLGWRMFIGGGPPFSLDLEPRELSVQAGQVEWLSGTVRDRTGTELFQPAIHFSSDTEDVAQVRYDQLCLPGCRDWVYVLGKAEGKATITAEYAGAIATATVTVVPPATGSAKGGP